VLTVQARHVRHTPRSGSSWPVVAETDAGPYFTKLRGAGDGPASLVAEVIVAGLAEALGLRVARRALVELGPDVTTENRDPELLDLLAASVGSNLGFEPLVGARDLRLEDVSRVDADEAAIIAWLDGLVQNPDRTRRNPNLMLWRGRLWLIDHGAALPFHRDWRAVTEDTPRRAVPDLSGHVLGARATPLGEWDDALARTLERRVLRAAVAEVPDAFLAPLLPAGAGAAALERRREAYVAFLWKRLRSPRPFVAECRAAN
jgi:hypothetical protein